MKKEVMNRINPAYLILLAFCVVMGALLGSALIGLAVGLGIGLVGAASDA